MLPLTNIGVATHGQGVVYGIRPEHLSLADPVITVKIAVVEPTGSETHVVAMLGQQEVVGVFRERVSRSSGALLELGVDVGKVHLFDAQNGERLN